MMAGMGHSLTELGKGSHPVCICQRWELLWEPLRQASGLLFRTTCMVLIWSSIYRSIYHKVMEP